MESTETIANVQTSNQTKTQLVCNQTSKPILFWATVFKVLAWIIVILCPIGSLLTALLEEDIYLIFLWVSASSIPFFITAVILKGFYTIVVKSEYQIAVMKNKYDIVNK